MNKIKSLYLKSFIEQNIFTYKRLVTHNILEFQYVYIKNYGTLKWVVF